MPLWLPVHPGTFQGNADVQSRCVQLLCSLNLLLSHNALWTATFARVTSTLISDLCERMASTVRKLGQHMALLLQVNNGLFLVVRFTRYQLGLLKFDDGKCSKDIIYQIGMCK